MPNRPAAPAVPIMAEIRHPDGTPATDAADAQRIADAIAAIGPIEADGPEFGIWIVPMDAETAAAMEADGFLDIATDAGRIIAEMP